MKIEQMIGRSGKAVANQFIIRESEGIAPNNCIEYFQSYKSIIAKRDKFRAGKENRQVWLDSIYWNYSRTTSKYRSLFLGESTKETQKKIDDGGRI